MKEQEQNIIKKTFEKCNFEEVEELFGLKRVYEHTVLQNWLNVEDRRVELEVEKELEKLKVNLLKNVDTWNEEDLKMKFIAHLLYMLDYDRADYRSFLERKLSATIGGVELSGKIDLVIAKGKRTPKAPFFCLHEYKQEQPSGSDPLGQVLAAMLVAQHKNEGTHPVYGVYIMGRFWFFVILEGKEYSVSNSYVATRRDIFTIYKALDKLKDLIGEMLKVPVL